MMIFTRSRVVCFSIDIIACTAKKDVMVSFGGVEECTMLLTWICRLDCFNSLILCELPSCLLFSLLEGLCSSGWVIDGVLPGACVYVFA